MIVLSPDFGCQRLWYNKRKIKLYVFVLFRRNSQAKRRHLRLLF